MAKDDDVLADAKEDFRRCEDAESDNRTDALDDIKFARLGEQWPAAIAAQRRAEARPMLVINKLPTYIRQVVNDARQNKPSIKVHPADSGADPEVAEIYNGLIRNIEYTSNADVAYDTATDNAVSNGFGYFRIGMDYSHADTFDMDLRIDRVSNPFSIYGDPNSTAADSSDWNVAFAVDIISKLAFERKYKSADKVDWEGDAYAELEAPWRSGDDVMVAEYWTREEYDKDILQLSDGTVTDEARLQKSPELQAAVQAGLIQVVRERKAKCWRVKQRILTGAEVLEDRIWPGQYIPIVPVYGDEVNVEGKRYFRSLIRDAKDPQRMFNFWRTNSTELVALAPRTPFIGPKGAFLTDADKWATVNSRNLPYVEYDGQTAPQRQPFVGPPAGALQEALNASDDMKGVMGLYDASMGAKSNETSGKAIMARQREGDVSTFHFLDNMARAIRHAGRILIDLIPHVYDKPRIVRVLGEDGKDEKKPVNQQTPVMDENGQPQVDEMGEAITRMFDLTAGKYDLTVTTGPGYTTRRQEAAEQMMGMIQAYPPAAPIIADLVAKNGDWPQADEVAERFKAMLPPQINSGIPPEMQQMIEQGKQAIEQGQQEVQRLTQENAGIKADKQAEMAKMQADAALNEQKMQLEARKLDLEEQKLLIAEYEARTARIVAQKPAPVPSSNPTQPRRAA